MNEEVFYLGINMGIDLGRHWGIGRTREALMCGHFLMAGCLDAPENIPAGGWESVEFGPTEDEHGIGPITVPRG